jgi:exonuclease SbcC
MQIQQLALRNIRSYGDTETVIPFTPGLTLFEGNIGSGKSTILNAIEFALFGLGDLDVKHLLRYGAKTGEVALTFEADGEVYTVRRFLKRSGKSIKQDSCILEDTRGNYSLSPSEIRVVILDILGFHEKPDPKSTSRIYRYAVYTPQESMKEILNMKDNARLDILRRAFGIEQYRWVIENGETILLRLSINPEIRRLTEDISSKSLFEDDLRKKYEEKKDLQNNMNSRDQEKKLLEKKIQEIEKEISILLPQKKKIEQLSGEIPALEREYTTLQEQIDDIKNSLSGLQQEQTDIEELEKEFEEIKSNYTEYQEKSVKIKKLEPIKRKFESLEKRKEKLEEKIETRKGQIEDDINQKKRKYEEKELFLEKIQKLSGEEKILNEEKKKEHNLTKQLESIQSALSSLDPVRDDLLKLKGEIPATKKEQDGLKKRIKDLKKDLEKFSRQLKKITTLEEQLKDLEPEYSKYNMIKAEISSLEPARTRYQSFEKEHMKLQLAIENKISTHDTTIENLQEDAEKYQKVIKYIQDLETQETALEKEKERLEKSLKDLESVTENISDQEREKQKHETILQSKGQEIKKLQKEWQEIDKIKVGAECPRCKQVLTEEHMRTVEHEYQKEIDKIQESKNDIQTKIVTIKKALSTLNRKHQQLAETPTHLKKAERKLTQIESELKNAREEFQSLGKKMKKLEHAIEGRNTGQVAREEKEELSRISHEMDILRPSIERFSQLKSRLDELEQKEVSSQYNKITGEISQKGSLVSHISDTRASIDSDQQRIEELTLELNQKNTKLEEGEEVFEKIAECERDQKKLRTELEKIQQNLKRLDQIPIEITHLQEKIDELEKIRSEFSELENILQNNLYSQKERDVVREVLGEIQNILPSMETYYKLEERIEELEGKNIVSVYSEYSTRLKEKPKLLKRIREIREKKEKTDKVLQAKHAEIVEKQQILQKGEPLFEHIDTLENEKDRELALLGDSRERIAELRAGLSHIDEQIKLIADELVICGQMEQSQFILKEIKGWLENLFIPAIDTIERSVLASIREQFNSLFQKSFQTLIDSGDLNVSITETFAPIVEQEGYEIDVHSLSGGEKTSVALAYRLALNAIVKQEVPTLRRSLLILDEPTDGLSSSQLYKLRDILRDTECEQIIMVSHEKELEGFVDTIYRVTKENGSSRVSA